MSLNCITLKWSDYCSTVAVPNKLASSFVHVLGNHICRLVSVNFVPWV